MNIDPAYIAARRVLLDALSALEPHRAALILVGAQAVYLRTTASTMSVAPYTTDADLALDPRRLSDSPSLEALLRANGFREQGGDGLGSWICETQVDGAVTPVAVDLLVPNRVAGERGRRSVALAGHDSHAARRSVGLEAALVDRGPMRIGSFEPTDGRSYILDVAGPGALLVAKIHKIGERLANDRRTDRLSDKDAADVYRLFQAVRIDAMVTALKSAREDPVASAVTDAALQMLVTQFGGRSGRGLAMAVRAVAATDPEAATMREVSAAYVRGLMDRLRT